MTVLAGCPVAAEPPIAPVAPMLFPGNRSPPLLFHLNERLKNDAWIRALFFLVLAQGEERRGVGGQRGMRRALRWRIAAKLIGGEW
jgi:hypothetical protein